MLVALAGVAGYLLGQIRFPAGVTGAATEGLVLDHLVPADSFSEIRNTKALLDALAIQFTHEVRLRTGLPLRGTEATDPRLAAVREERLRLSIEAIEAGCREFEGTDQELILLQDLLLYLKREQQAERWVEVYLRVLYEHPTHEIVGRFARDAISLGRASGRIEDVLAAFRHVGAIPLDFNARQEVERQMRQAGLRPWVASLDRGPAS